MPRNASTLSAMAFTAQLAGDNGAAIGLYHRALGLCPDDRRVMHPRRWFPGRPASRLVSCPANRFAQDMLTQAVTEAAMEV